MTSSSSKSMPCKFHDQHLHHSHLLPWLKNLQVVFYSVWNIGKHYRPLRLWLCHSIWSTNHNHNVSLTSFWNLHLHVLTVFQFSFFWCVFFICWHSGPICGYIFCHWFVFALSWFCTVYCHSIFTCHSAFCLSLSKCLKLKAWVIFPRWKHWLRSFLWKLVNIKSHSSKISTEGDDCILTWFPGVKNRSTANIFKNKKVCMHVLDKKKLSLVL